MQPPIPAGAILQNRYRLVKVLGQGGFGRTYLAEDQGRFNEPCALKEFIPTQAGAYALEKSKELFQREAAILYQIQHPQIPQFRATFEENERLFLVQDYVEGKSFRELLDERKLKGQTFTEPEVLQLLQQVLPILAHIHSKGIIHRDIAPDNIMLRQRDNLPVLIDFGVVKEIVTRFQLPGMTAQHTTVGKLGYAPSEQMQTGRAYPSSDLYSLAVTAVVLLTGREPQDLYDDVNLSWNWQQYGAVRPGVAQILNRMLNYRPGDRYQSVQEVAQALQLVVNPAAAAPSGTAVAAQPPATAAASPPRPNAISQMQTIAVGRRAEPAPVSPRRPGRSVPSPAGQSVWDNPWAVVGICLGLAVVTGIGSWAVVNAILNTSDGSSTPTASPTATASPTDSPSPTPTATPTEPVEYTQQLAIAPGETTTAEGNLKANETVSYRITAEAGETLSASLDDEGVLLTVLGPDERPVNNSARRTRSWSGTLEESGDYAIQISPVQNVAESNYRVTIGLEPALEPEPDPEPDPEPEPEPPPQPPQLINQRIEFPAGSDSIRVAERVAPNLIRRYQVNAQAGQTMNIDLVQGDATFDVRYPNGELVEDSAGVSSWQAQLPEGGDYTIDVQANDAVDFVLELEITGDRF